MRSTRTLLTSVRPSVRLSVRSTVRPSERFPGPTMYNCDVVFAAVVFCGLCSFGRPPSDAAAPPDRPSDVEAPSDRPSAVTPVPDGLKPSVQSTYPRFGLGRPFSPRCVFPEPIIAAAGRTPYRRHRPRATPNLTPMSPDSRGSGGGAGLWSAINNGSPPTRCRVIVSNQTRRIGLRLRLDNLSDGNPAMF